MVRRLPLLRKDSRGKADGRTGGGLMPDFIMQDFPPAVRKDLQEAGKGGKTTDVEAIPEASGFFPEAVRIQMDEMVKEILVMGPGLGLHGGGRHVVAEFGPNVGQINACNDERILSRFLDQVFQIFQKAACDLLIGLPGVI